MKLHLGFSSLPDFGTTGDPGVPGVGGWRIGNSGIRDFENSGIREFGTSGVRDFGNSGIRESRISEIRF